MFTTISHGLNVGCFQDAEAEDLTTKLDQLKKDEKDRQRKIKELENSIEKIKAELAIPLETENADELMTEHVKFRVEHF